MPHAQAGVRHSSTRTGERYTPYLVEPHTPYSITKIYNRKISVEFNYLNVRNVLAAHTELNAT